jgi:DNA-binding transcriptional ArsR family regulator
MTARRAREVVVLVPALEEQHAAVLAMLTDGELWSTSALALALGASQRTVQRALDALSGAGKAHPVGRGRAQRWTGTPLLGFTTVMLLPSPLSID